MQGFPFLPVTIIKKAEMAASIRYQKLIIRKWAFILTHARKLVWMKFIIVVLSVWLLACTALAAPSLRAWDNFLANPSKQNFLVLNTQLQRCRERVCDLDITPDSKSVNRLRILIDKGNIKAIRIGFSIVPLLDGGDLEDVERDLGMIADYNPQLFLEMVNKNHYPDDLINDAVNMLPEYVIDTEKARIKALQFRIHSLAKVKNPKLINVRNKAISFLHDSLSE